MKKVLSFVLVLVMVLAVVPFGAFSLNASAVAVDYSDNLALGKSYTISVTNKGITSAYHPIKCNANLTDGKITNDTSATAIGNNSWLAVQTYSNCLSNSSNGYGYIAEINIDLGETYNVSEVRVHFANIEKKLSDGCNFKALIDCFDVYGGWYPGFGEYSFGCIDVRNKTGANWAEFKANEVKPVRHIKCTITLDHVSEEVIYGLVDEIEVFGAYNNVVKYTEYAKNASYKIYNPDGSVVKATRGYTGKLTDGISDVPVITEKKNPITGKYNYNNGNWFGLFTNSATSEQNCPDGYAYIWIDLGSVKEINKIRIFTAYGYEVGIYDTFYYSNDNVNFGRMYAAYEPVTEGKYGEWRESDFTVECRYIVLRVAVWDYWALFNEMQILGHNTVNVAEGKSYTINGVSQEDFKYARGYTGDLTDGIYDEALVSWLPNPVTGVENYSNGKYLGLFKNADAPDESNISGYQSFIVVDLGQLCEISLVKMFFANGYAGACTAYFSTDGVNYSDYGEHMYTSSEAGVHGEWEETSCQTIARYVKIRVSHFNTMWTLMSEVVIKGNPVA